jgi:hypothetical protein
VYTEPPAQRHCDGDAGAGAGAGEGASGSRDGAVALGGHSRDPPDPLPPRVPPSCDRQPPHRQVLRPSPALAQLAGGPARDLRGRAGGQSAGRALLPQPDCLLIVYQCTRTHSPHPPPRPGHSFPDCLLMVYQCARTHSPRPPPWPGHSPPFQLNLTVCSRCTGVPVHTRPTRMRAIHKHFSPAHTEHL